MSMDRTGDYQKRVECPAIDQHIYGAKADKVEIGVSSTNGTGMIRFPYAKQTNKQKTNFIPHLMRHKEINAK